METQPQWPNAQLYITVRPLRESDLAAADRIFRLAFGTFLGLPDPITFGTDTDYLRTRWKADPTRAFGAEVDGVLVGSNIASNWGSVGFFGPLSVHPDLWGQGIAQHLMEPIMDCFTKWGTKHAGLFTFSQSPKHIYLYQKFGFWPRFLTPIMSKTAIQTSSVLHRSKYSDPRRYSELKKSEREGCLNACRDLTNAIYEGLDLAREIKAVQEQQIGDTVLLLDDTKLVGFAVCHCGGGTEAASGVCYVKFGAVRPGQMAGRYFTQLLNACEALASASGMSRVIAGVNTACHEAYRHMLTSGYHTDFEGIAMQKPNESGYNRPDVFLISDWR